MRRRVCRPPRLITGGAPALPPALPEAGAASLPQRRFLALHLPRLATDRLGGTGPLVTWGLRRQRRLVLAVNAAAEAAGMRPDQPLADAQAICPGLRAEPEAPDAVRDLLHRLGLWALRYTPLAGIDAPDALLLDITGCDAGWSGIAALRDDAVARLGRRGLAVTGAVAGTPDAALALARAGRSALVAPGAEAAATAPLPLSALPLEVSLRTALYRLGLWHVGDLRAQPRRPLARRFGPELLALLDGVAGQRTRPILPLRPPAEFLAARDLAEPIVTREAVDAVFALLLDDLCVQLSEAGRGARRLLLRAHGVDAAVQEITVGTTLPMRSPPHLARLFRDRLEELAPGFGFDRLSLHAELTEPLDAAQDGFAGSDAAGASNRAALSQLLDRLALRLSVWRLAPQASHLPERAATRAPPLSEDTATPEHWLARPRPVRLLLRPEPVEVVALLPDDPPMLLRWRNRSFRVRRAEGPERVLPEWWRDAPNRAARDYYRLEVESGERLWVCRVGHSTPPRWFLHGFLA
ncbi:DNA polymerase Y family protein [Roseomonas sp. BN140053]|uniref:Y-family DNA polymerase n=1 Tax=Roseomonas sp. BN140053 TaxID=3391898 RepID=UPI0039EA7FC7